MTGKLCTKCGQPKLYFGRCKPCRAKRRHERDSTPEGRRKIAERNRRARSADPDRIKTYKLRDSFGITLKEYNEISQVQGGVCAICKQPEPIKNYMYVDHDHKTGQIRGLLCGKHNLGIGFFDDNEEMLDNAIAYLETR